MKKVMKNFFMLSIFIVAMSCANESAESTVQTDLIFGGDIVTMEGDDLAYAEAVVFAGDEILFVGSESQALKKFPESNAIDLKGKTLMPGFVEPHLHPSLAAIMLKNEIIAPYDWVLPSGTKKGVSTPDEYIERITTSIQENAVKNEIYFIWGYHQLWHGELNRSILNEIAGDQPVGIIHRSFHEIFLNDAAIEVLKLEKKTLKTTHK